ncbi:MAG: thiamine phosphate synthase [Candidatus Omnitrophota bacterium]|nr:thiamine phosphate synthase [Candidatus Omnitrophota bacterium]
MLRDSNLYLILDRQVNRYAELFDIVGQAVKSGVNIIQLRDKDGTATEILEFSREIRSLIPRHVLFIINDRVDLAIVSQADGVHLGQNDLSVLWARKLMGAKAVIGISCQTYQQARDAEKQGADYIGLGSVFKTLTKPERSAMDVALLKKVYKQIKIPVFAIGGINVNNIPTLRSWGVNRVAVCRDICLANNVRKVCQEFKNSLGSLVIVKRA